MATRQDEENEALQAVLVALPAIGAATAYRSIRQLVAAAIRTGRTLDVAAVRTVLEQQLADATSVVERFVVRSASEGRRQAARTFSAATGRVVRPSPPALRLRLSPRVWGTQAEAAAREIVDAVARVQAAQRATWAVVDQIRAAGMAPSGMGPTAAMERLRQAAVQTIRSAPGAPPSRAMIAARRQVLRDIARLRTSDYAASAREALERIDRAVAKGAEAAVNRAVAWQTYHKQQVRIRQVADEQRVRAFCEEYVREASQYPGVTGFRWVAEPDACERCKAEEGRTALVPPLHPHCRCHLSMIVAG